jgi:carbon monoxide dehydrogenase subunit G
LAHYAATIVVPRPPAEAFAYLADFANTAEWDPGIVSAVRSPDDGDAPVGAGSRFDLVSAFYGRRISLTYVIEEFVPHERVVLVADTSSVRSRDVITFAPAGEGTSITYDATLNLKGVLRVFDKGLQLAFGGIGDRAVAGLKKALGA